MADTYSAQLRLLQQTDQGNVNIWGKNWNDGVIDLTEAAIAGRADIDLTLGSVSLTMANGSVDTSRPMFLRVTGTLGAAKNIIVPSLQKLYIVSNQTTDSQNIEVRTTANPGETITPGQSVMLYVDQANDLVTPVIDSTNIVVTPSAESTIEFAIDNVSGSPTFNVNYYREGGMIYVRIPAFSETFTDAEASIELIPQTTIPADLLPSGPLAFEFPLCMTDDGNNVSAYIRVPITSGNWLLRRADAANWSAAVVRAMVHPLTFVMPQVA